MLHLRSLLVAVSVVCAGIWFVAAGGRTSPGGTGPNCALTDTFMVN
jgi:hypothetical protein